MEKQTTPHFLTENLVSTKKYAALYDVTQKTVYDWINSGRLTMIPFLDKNWLDKTVKVKPTEKQLKAA